MLRQASRGLLGLIRAQSAAVVSRRSSDVVSAAPLNYEQDHGNRDFKRVAAVVRAKGRAGVHG